MSLPSYTTPAGSATPARAENVGKMSRLLTISSERLAGSIWPRQCANALCRIPPSHVPATEATDKDHHRFIKSGSRSGTDADCNCTPIIWSGRQQGETDARKINYTGSRTLRKAIVSSDWEVYDSLYNFQSFAHLFLLAAFRSKLLEYSCNLRLSRSLNDFR